MSTSVLISYRDPNESGRNSPYGFSRNACFGDTNRLGNHSTAEMDVMEWHPQMSGTVGTVGTATYKTPRKAFEFINSFGCWEGVFHMTPMRSVAAMVKENPADCIITGFMTMRDYQECANTKIFERETDLDPKIEFALYCAGIYKDRYAQSGRGLSLQLMQNVSYGEHGTCYLRNNDDAIGLYLLAYGSKAEFNGCWAQGIIGVDRENMQGYVRNSSDSSRREIIQRRRPGWENMADWLRTWLRTNPEQFAGKMGRLTVSAFHQRLAARLNSSDRNDAPAIITQMFEELRDMYA